MSCIVEILLLHSSLNNLYKLIRYYKLFNKLFEINRIFPGTVLFGFRNIGLVITYLKRV